jgi:hypothetical protein
MKEAVMHTIDKTYSDRRVTSPVRIFLRRDISPGGTLPDVKA